MDEVQEQVLAVPQIVQRLAPGHLGLRALDEIGGSEEAAAGLSLRGGAPHHEEHDQGAHDEAEGGPCEGRPQDGKARREEEARDPPAPARLPFGRKNAVRDLGGQRVPIDGGHRLIHFVPDEARGPDDAFHGIDLLPAGPASLEAGHKPFRPLRAQPPGPEGLPIPAMFPACVHDCVPKYGVSHFLRLRTALKWRDFAVPKEMFMASEISLN